MRISTIILSLIILILICTNYYTAGRYMGQKEGILLLCENYNMVADVANDEGDLIYNITKEHYSDSMGELPKVKKFLNCQTLEVEP